MRYGNCRRSAQVRKFEMKFEVYEVQRTYNGPCGTTPRTVVNGLAFRTVCDGGSLMLVAARVVLVCCVLPWSFPARVSCPRLRFGSMLCRGRSVHQSHARTRWRFSWHTDMHQQPRVRRESKGERGVVGVRLEPQQCFVGDVQTPYKLQLDLLSGCSSPARWRAPPERQGQS
jgi:hypothetical protein